MGQELSRPVRWTAAINRATDAKYELQALRDQLIDACEGVADQWAAKRKIFNDALGELIHLQRDYATANVPYNLSNSRTAEKQNSVARVDFEGMLEKVPDLKEVINTLLKFDPQDDVDFMALEEAKAVAPPKFYGRD